MVVAAHKRMEEQVRQQWAQGLDWVDEARFVVTYCETIRALSFDDIAQVYEVDPGADTVLIDETPLGLYADEEDEEEER